MIKEFDHYICRNDNGKIVIDEVAISDPEDAIMIARSRASKTDMQIAVVKVIWQKSGHLSQSDRARRSGL